MNLQLLKVGDKVLLTCWYVFRLSHQWGFEDLEKSICEYLQAVLDVRNVCAILDTAIIFGLKSLVNTCAVFADTNSSVLLDHPSFMTLSPVCFHYKELIKLWIY